MHAGTTDPHGAPRPGPPGDPRGEDPWRTSTSLLIRIRDRSDQRAWAAFDRRYSPLIRRWCREWFPRDADDLVQEVLAKLVASAGAFDYDPRRGRFRGWLKTVTRHLMADLGRRPPLPGKGVALDHPEAVAREARLDLEQRLRAEYDLELLEAARQRVRPRVDPRTWSAYVATAERGRPPDEVAQELGLPVGSVYQARYSVVTLLKREVKALGRDG
jgi:RNA polymerase sigma-70 factor (ECF subfamily)